METLSSQLTAVGFDVFTYSSKKNKLFRFLNMLWGVLSKGAKAHTILIDTYSTQNFYYAVAVANLCRLFGWSYIPILHGGNLPERLQKNKFLSHRLFHGAKTNITPSQYLMEAFKAKGYHNLTYIPNTIVVKDYSFLLRNKINPRLLWVRSFAEIYNPMLALKLVEKLMPRYPNITLCMIGPEKDGSQQKCMEYAKNHNLPVTFTGKLSKEAWRKKSTDFDIFINTTNFDNTPVSLIEAMALGLPVVSTNVGGIPYLVEDRKDGILVPVDNVQSFEKAIAELCTDNELAQTLTINARKKAEDFDWENVKQHWLSLLKE
ncbi:MAG: glycosyltransferase family 4 protein [Flavobacteriaceae bacterium]|nr:glycosyltransferase family 4 protein [Flavobacteriaceae bacterium]